MNFTFTSFLSNGMRDITTRIEDLPKMLWKGAGDRLIVSDNMDLTADDLIFESEADFYSWVEMMSRRQWKDKPKAEATQKLKQTFDELGLAHKPVCGYIDANGALVMLGHDNIEEKFRVSPEKVEEAVRQMISHGTSLLDRIRPPVCKEAPVGKEEAPINSCSDGLKSAVNPSHYQAYVFDPHLDVELQWLETMCRMQRYRSNPERFVGAVELQIRKYMDRLGGKDGELQELLKALWYMKFLCAYIIAGYQPILVKDVDALISNHKS